MPPPAPRRPPWFPALYYASAVGCGVGFGWALFQLPLGAAVGALCLASAGYALVLRRENR